MLDVDLDAVLDAFIAKPTLKTATLQLTTLTQLQVVANVLGSPNCSITELDIRFRFNRINPDMGQLKHEQLSQTLVNSLQRNTSVSTLGCGFGRSSATSSGLSSRISYVTLQT
jgi:hypothetical protein